MLLLNSRLSSLLKKLLVLMGVYSLLRLLFLISNFSYFNSSSALDLALSFLTGLRFDWVAVTLINLPVFAVHLLPQRLFELPWTRRINRLLFFVLNIPFLTANCIDLELFRFSSRRLTADIFSIMGFGHDFINTTPKMIMDFWPATLILVVLTWGLTVTYRKFIDTVEPEKTFVPRHFKWMNPLLIVCLGFFGFRGGAQYKPLSILSASAFHLNKEVPLVLNSSFTLLKTVGKSELHRYFYYDGPTVTRLAPVFHTNNTTPFRKMNVVVLILEGIGKEYIGSMNGNTGYTPFLDSLFRHALVFNQAFANGKRSIEGIPAVVAGIPSLNDLPYISSPYSGNIINTLPNLLKPYGYSSIFFHGGTNGTMGFDGFSAVAGFDRYYGRTEYAGEKDFDGNWGIPDMPFLQRAVVELNAMKQPFTATIFTLSSHHPYKVPAPYDKSIPTGPLPIHQSVRYADEAVRMFFEKAKACSWYNNTLFVVTSDHTALSNSQLYQTRTGIYSIPIVYFDPGNPLNGISERTTQQIDILPSVLDYLHYPAPYFALGTSVFDSTATPFAINFLLDNFQLISNGYTYTLDTLNGSSLYNYINDPFLTTNIKTQQSQLNARMDSLTKAIVQQYSSSLLENRTHASSTSDKQ